MCIIMAFIKIYLTNLAHTDINNTFSHTSISITAYKLNKNMVSMTKHFNMEYLTSFNLEMKQKMKKNCMFLFLFIFLSFS